jgi:hypothetical protein
VANNVEVNTNEVDVVEKLNDLEKT